MKKSFLQTFIVLGLFSIFLFGSVAVNFVYAANRELINGNGNPTRVDWTDTNTKVKQEAWKYTYNDGTSVISYRPLGSNEQYSSDFYKSDGRTKINEYPVKVKTPDGNLAGYAGYTKEATQTDTEKQAGSEGSQDNMFDNSLQTLAMSLLIYGSKFVSWLVGFVGYFFDKVIEYTTTYPESLSQGITNSWKIIRDFSNIILVFSLLYLGIKTIIEGQGFSDKKTLVGIIIAAILINFSLVFVRDVAFNISNTVGLQILQQSGTGTDNASSTPSTQLMSIINPQQVLNMNGFNTEWGATNIAINDRTGWGLTARMTGQFLMFTSIVLSMGVIFLGASIILLYRFMIFIVLMIASPFGLISTQIPWLQKYGKDWSEQLKKQTIIFPAFMLILYLVLLIVTTLAAYNPITLNATNTTTTEIFSFLFNFILIMGFLISLLIIPGKIGAAGADFMTNAAGWTTKKIKSIPRGTGRMAIRTTQFGAGVGASAAARTGRFFGGGIGENITNSKRLKKMAQSDSFVKRTIGQAALNLGDGMQNSSYDARNIGVVKKSSFGKGMGSGIESYKKAVDTKKKALEARKKREMELFGFDKRKDDPTIKASLQDAKAERSRADQAYERAERDFRQTSSDLAEARRTSTGSVLDQMRIIAIENNLQTQRETLNRTITDVENAEKVVGKLSNIGEFEWTNQAQKRWFVGGSPSQTSQAAFRKITKDLSKKAEKDGQSTKKKKDAAALAPLNTPPAAPPPPATP